MRMRGSRRFTRSNLHHPTFQWLHDLGRVIKTIFLCEFLSDQRLRQELQEALNVIERWNSVNGFIFPARGGELLSNRPEDQEIAVLCLHLIQVSLALINTLLLQEVLAEDTWKAPMKPEDWRGLTPLFYQHVNPYGRFTQGFLVYPYSRKSLPHSSCKASTGWAQKWRI